jgi:hypothetical protein
MSQKERTRNIDTDRENNDALRGVEGLGGDGSGVPRSKDEVGMPLSFPKCTAVFCFICNADTGKEDNLNVVLGVT